MIGTYVNARLIREAILQQDLSERDVCSKSSIGETVFRTAINEGLLSKTFTVSALARLAEVCGLTVSELLAPPELRVTRRSEHDGPGEDHQLMTEGDEPAQLLSLLYEAGSDQVDSRVAMALGWPLSRVDQVADRLAHMLTPLGLRVFRSSERIGIRSLDLDMIDTARRLKEMREAQHGINQAAARILLKVLEGRLSTTDTTTGSGPQLQHLHNMGAIYLHPSTGQRAQITDATRYCLTVD